MKKTFVAVVLCMALLSSFTVSASAEFDNTDSSNLFTLSETAGDVNPTILPKSFIEILPQVKCFFYKALIF